MAHEYDPAPTYKKYPDRGCVYSPLCLDCSLPKCIYELSIKEQAYLRKQDRDMAIVKGHTEGISTEELAKQYGVNERTIQRIIKRSKRA